MLARRNLKSLRVKLINVAVLSKIKTRTKNKITGNESPQIHSYLSYPTHLRSSGYQKPTGTIFPYFPFFVGINIQKY